MGDVLSYDDGVCGLRMLARFVLGFHRCASDTVWSREERLELVGAMIK